MPQIFPMFISQGHQDCKFIVSTLLFKKNPYLVTIYVTIELILIMDNEITVITFKFMRLNVF